MREVARNIGGEIPVHAILVERVLVRAGDGNNTTLVAFDDVNDGVAIRLCMLATGERCTAIDQDSWRVEDSGLVFRRVSPRKSTKSAGAGGPSRAELRRRVRAAARAARDTADRSREFALESRAILNRVRRIKKTAKISG